ncbi:hypothetical protein [Bacillus amyloliquefaciens]|uniref:hypothetical protein n=1 Tax=Bacillus amyloliquefaciens TaxID=1390 RepID=UPI000E27CD64|nr:hypothetical protein [Bacillus amyloliquefaciens]RDY82944.1 hypothetical protein C3733_20375 [Bacillus amyloliquefaciens]
MIEFTRPIPMKKTCTLHSFKKAVRSVSFTDDNDHTTTITLCEICLNELRFKAGVEFEKFTNEGDHPEDEASQKRDYRPDDLSGLGVHSISGHDMEDERG